MKEGNESAHLRATSAQSDRPRHGRVVLHNMKESEEYKDFAESVPKIAEPEMGAYRLTKPGKKTLIFPFVNKEPANMTSPR